MREEWTLRVIARMESDYTAKFGVPRQSGMVLEERGAVVFEPAYRDENALRGILGYSHLWLLWGFSEVERPEGFSPMVKPPRLGGNRRMGVFATRSPYRPNPIGLSSVALLGTERRPGKGTVLLVAGADLKNGTPIYDIKPYLSFTDSHPDAKNGFAAAHEDDRLEVTFPDELLERVPEQKRAALIAALSLDPRPGYQENPDFRYGFSYAGLDVRFSVSDGVLTVFDVTEAGAPDIK